MESDYERLLKSLLVQKNQETFFLNIGGKKLRLTIDEIVDEEPAVQSFPLGGRKDTTIVTGLWNLGRGDMPESSFKRSYEHYKQKFAELLRAPSNMIIYVAAEDEEFIWKHRSRENTLVKTMELQEFKTWFEFFEKVQSIRTKESWYSQAGWLADSPQAKLEYYNPIVMSKMFLLNNATLFNPFDSEYFYWIDAGITNTVHPGYFYHDKVFDNLSTYAKAVPGFLYLSYPYEGGYEIHGFPRADIANYCKTDYVKYVCRGGFFGGEKRLINEMNSFYYRMLSTTINKELMGTEESVFTILAHIYPDMINRFEIQSDGMVWPFFEKLKNVEQMIKDTPRRPLTVSTAKNNLYILGFNSPQQFESICLSLQASDSNFLEKSRKILINNSTDESTFSAYDALCEKFEFEEIHRENLGVCGGRQFAAEHFEESDADFYMFFEDDMHINEVKSKGELCRNGFSTYVPNLYEKVVNIIIKEKLDFLKFSFSEFFGDNSVQWSWYNVPQDVRTQIWPDHDKLPEVGLDPNAPKTKFDTINYMDGVPYIKGQIYYSNWPQIVSREGNKKMFIETKWAHPYEQTWMSHIFQLTLQEKIKSAVLLASPVNHHRFEHYPGELRKES